MDYELEWAMVSGRAGVNIRAEDAGQHIFGDTIFNDVSARDIQAVEIARRRHGRSGQGFRCGQRHGPCIVTADELPDPYNLTMTARINGEEWSRGNTGMMDHKFEGVLAHLSRNQTIQPGEIFGSGTGRAAAAWSTTSICRTAIPSSWMSRDRRSAQRYCQTGRLAPPTPDKNWREEFMPRNIRRVITGHDDDGKAVVIIDETMTPDMGHVLTPQGGEYAPIRCLAEPIPPAGGAVFRVLELPPDPSATTIR